MKPTPLIFVPIIMEVMVIWGTLDCVHEMRIFRGAYKIEFMTSHEKAKAYLSCTGKKLPKLLREGFARCEEE